MDIGSSGTSNSLALIDFIQTMAGETFAEQSKNACKVLDARLSRVGQGSDGWHHLLRTKGLVEGLIRFDGDVPSELEVTESALQLSVAA